MKHFLFFSCFCIVSSLFSAHEYIDGDFFSEIEEQYEKSTEKIFQGFLNECKEENKLHDESILTEKKEDSLCFFTGKIRFISKGN